MVHDAWNIAEAHTNQYVADTNCATENAPDQLCRATNISIERRSTLRNKWYLGIERILVNESSQPFPIPMEVQQQRKEFMFHAIAKHHNTAATMMQIKLEMILGEIPKQVFHWGTGGHHMDIVPQDLLDGFNGYEPLTIACQCPSTEEERIRDKKEIRGENKGTGWPCLMRWSGLAGLDWPVPEGVWLSAWSVWAASLTV